MLIYTDKTNYKKKEKTNFNIHISINIEKTNFDKQKEIHVF